MFYATLSLLLHFFTLERAPLDDPKAKDAVFPQFRAASEASLDMDPIIDQISQCDAQGLPKYVGVKLTPRNSEALVAWLQEGYKDLEELVKLDASLASARAEAL